MYSKEYFQRITTDNELNIQNIESKYFVIDNVQLNSIQFQPNKPNEFLIEEKEFDGTENFYRSILKLLKIPYSFSLDISRDLLLINFDELKRENTKLVRLICRDDNILVNIVPLFDSKRMRPITYQTVKTDEILSYFVTFNDNDSSNIVNMIVSDLYGTIIDVVSESLGTININDDIYELGYRLYNPITYNKKASLQASLMLFANDRKTLILLPRSIFSISTDLRKEYIDATHCVESFRNSLNEVINLKIDFQTIEQEIRLMQDSKITFKSLKPIFNKIKSTDLVLFETIFSEGLKFFDEMFKTNETETWDQTYYDLIQKINQISKGLSDKIQLIDSIELIRYIVANFKKTRNEG